jgi:hypothetical protein
MPHVTPAAHGAAFPAAARDLGHGGGDGRVPGPAQVRARALANAGARRPLRSRAVLLVASSQLARCHGSSESCLARGSLRQLGPPRTSASSTGPPHWQLPRVHDPPLSQAQAATRVFGPKIKVLTPAADNASPLPSRRRPRRRIRLGVLRRLHTRSSPARVAGSAASALVSLQVLIGR